MADFVGSGDAAISFFQHKMIQEDIALLAIFQHKENLLVLLWTPPDEVDCQVHSLRSEKNQKQ
jgi:hypothetical protein